MYITIMKIKIIKNNQSLSNLKNKNYFLENIIVQVRYFLNIS